MIDTLRYHLPNAGPGFYRISHSQAQQIARLIEVLQIEIDEQALAIAQHKQQANFYCINKHGEVRSYGELDINMSTSLGSTVIDTQAGQYITPSKDTHKIKEM